MRRVERSSHRAELFLDPAFKPDGVRDGERGSLFGETTVSTQVAFIGATYRSAASNSSRESGEQ